jgi:hypothetical protein
MKLFARFRQAIGIKNRHTVKEIKKDGNLVAAALLSDEERKTLGRAERMERFEKWRREEGL